ncbi:MAG: PAS domain-containing protein [Aquabacterium sp.]
MDRTDAYYMQRLVDHVPSMLAYWDSDLRCRFANVAYKTWFGVDPAQMIGMRMQDLLGPRLFELNQPYIQGALHGREQTFERIVPGPDGVQRHSLAKYVPDIVDGKVRGFIAHVTEITALKRIEAALRASESFLDRTGRIARVGGWEVDLERDVRIWSDQLCAILGLEPGHRPTREEALQYIAPEAREMVAQAVAHGVQGTPWDIEMPVITRQGHRLWVRSIGEPVFNDEGRAIRLVGAVQDITEQVEHRAELAREQSMRAQLEQQARELTSLLGERDDMLDVLAHEVRQPLHNASAALQSAQAALTQVKEQVATPRLVRAQSVLTQVMAGLDNTLAAATLLARSAPIEMEDTDIDTLIAVAIADMAQADRTRIIVQRVTRLRTAVMDMSLMRLAVRNLLSNALKYSAPQSPVIIKLYDSDDPLGLVIDVENQGPPIPASLLPTLFQRGARAAHHGAPVGLGLGLYIVKRVMDLHGGRVELAHNAAPGVIMRLLLTAAT